MPSTSRPRNFASGSNNTGRTATSTPMSERQQLALLMQMTSNTNQAGMCSIAAPSHPFAHLICIFLRFLCTELSPGSNSSGGGSGTGGGANSSGTGNNGPARSRDRNERGETAMHVAAIKGDQEGIKKLLEQGMSPNTADFAGKTQHHNTPRAFHRVRPFIEIVCSFSFRI